jgi:hypothetical protein
MNHKNDITAQETKFQNMMNILQENYELSQFVKTFDDQENGFMFSSNKHLSSISQLVDDDAHSGASFACCLRECQYRLKLLNETNNNLDFQTFM